MMTVVYHDITNYPEVEAELKAVRTAMEEVCRQADFVSINLPLLPGARGCI